MIVARGRRGRGGGSHVGNQTTATHWDGASGPVLMDASEGLRERNTQTHTKLRLDGACETRVDFSPRAR